jgi:LTXXQ motif family protein
MKFDLSAGVQLCICRRSQHQFNGTQGRIKGIAKMKAKSMFIIAVLTAIMPITLPAATKAGEGSTTKLISVAVSAEDSAIPQDDTVLSDASTAPTAAPHGPKELLDDYEGEMAAIAQKFSATLAAITGAVQHGQLTSEQGQQISAEQYEMAEMQFELLGAWRAMLEHDLARVPGHDAETTPAPAEDNEIVTVALPFSSFELNSSALEYLRLSKSQAEAIQQVMILERQKIDPLMEQLRTAREKLLAASREHTNEKEIKGLANEQAGLLAKLIVANARMHAKVYKLLSPEQQRKLDEFTRGSDLNISR